ncbi:hypothetical protein [Streptomyces sp. CB00455]|nr:hypothetical protein [Streptomyces sp. CB00455]
MLDHPGRQRSRFADSSMLLLRATRRLVLAGPLPAQLARLLDVTADG